QQTFCSHPRSRPWPGFTARAVRNATTLRRFGHRPCAATRRPGPRAGPGLGFAQLRRREDRLRQARVAHIDLKLDEAVAADSRAHGKRQAVESELEMGDLQPFGRYCDLAVRREPGLAKPDAERRAGVGGWNDDCGNVDAQHVTSLSESACSAAVRTESDSGETICALRKSWGLVSGSAPSLAYTRMVCGVNRRAAFVSYQREVCSVTLKARRRQGMPALRPIRTLD